MNNLYRKVRRRDRNGIMRTLYIKRQRFGIKKNPPEWNGYQLRKCKGRIRNIIMEENINEDMMDDLIKVNINIKLIANKKVLNKDTCYYINVNLTATINYNKYFKKFPESPLRKFKEQNEDDIEPISIVFNIEQSDIKTHPFFKNKVPQNIKELESTDCSLMAFYNYITLFMMENNLRFSKNEKKIWNKLAYLLFCYLLNALLEREFIYPHYMVKVLAAGTLPGKDMKKLIDHYKSMGFKLIHEKPNYLISTVDKLMTKCYHKGKLVKQSK